MKRVFTTISLALVALVACNKAEEPVAAEQQGSVSISCNVTSEVEDTRAEVSCTLPAIDEFSLTIDGISQDYHAEYASVAEFQESYLHNGSYKASVKAGDLNVEGFDCATFEGEAEFTVVSRQHTDVEVTATIANSLVKVEVTEAFKSYFAGGYEFTLKTELGNEYDVTEQSDYLFVAPTSIEILATATKQPNESGAEGKVVTLPTERIENLEPRTTYVVKFDVSTAGEATLQITLNDSLVEERNIDNELNQYA